MSQHLDMTTAIERMGDRGLYIEICHCLALELPNLQQSIAANLAAGAWDEARRLSHSLKSNCATIGAEALRAQMYELEIACRDSDEEKACTIFQAVDPELTELREQLLGLA